MVVTGVESFVCKEYQYVGVFMVAFAMLIFLLLGSIEQFGTQSRPCKFDPSNTCKPALVTAVFSAVSFLLGAFTSVLYGFLGKKIAIYTNARTALQTSNFNGRTFTAPFRSGAVMGFLLAAIGLLVLYLAICLFKLYYGNDWEGLFEAITGYGLGGSSMALFGRVGGGIYAKAANVCVHLVKRTQQNFPEDDRSPAVITNCVGDIVGDIAGMGTDLFGSYAESSCAALVIASISSFGMEHNFTAMCYPLLISSMGILVGSITTLVWKIKPGLKKQLIISTTLMTGGIAILSWIALPSSFTIYNFGSQKDVKNWQLALCVGVGLWAGLVIEFVTKCYPKNTPSCLRDAASHNVSVALTSIRIPFFAAVSIFVGSSFAATYGIAVAALGMLGTIATRLAVDACGPIYDNAKRIAEMANGEDLDAAGNTPAANGKGFAIESAALVSIALFGAFLNRLAMSSVDVLTPKVIFGLIMGAGLPYSFSAMTMRSVGSAGLQMAEKVCKQCGSDLMVGDEEPDYAACFETSALASFRGMIGPVALVMFTPLIVGTVFGVETLSGVLAGSLSSVVQIGVSPSNTGGAWSKVREDIRAGALKYAKGHCSDDRRLRRIAKRGKTFGHPLKDISGPPLNVIVQLMAVESLVFAPFFASHGGLLFKYF
ncbi:hypothetical protein BT93_L5521 [Corymbia citriodora subsp. variegata]|uniref:H(+)-exporting diphosphatase n=1 Tax=Corymbia citriodora subsp. variegata TaxID=360336 RepID=A0A8T0CSB9_CORYI|nr:hypothetical protein BT93_L5521 [Corymbia citriodora subsp. variegata]